MILSSYHHEENVTGVVGEGAGRGSGEREREREMGEWESDAGRKTEMAETREAEGLKKDGGDGDLNIWANVCSDEDCMSTHTHNTSHKPSHFILKPFAKIT